MEVEAPGRLMLLPNRHFRHPWRSSISAPAESTFPPSLAVNFGAFLRVAQVFQLCLIATCSGGVSLGLSQFVQTD